MTRSIDEILDEIRRLSASIDAPATSASDRKRLEARRTELRDEAAAMAARFRHPDSVRTEIELIEHRLAELDAMLIGAGYSEKHLHRTVQDPGAYRYAINRQIEDNHSAEIAELRARLEHLRSNAPDPSP